MKPKQPVVVERTRMVECFQAELDLAELRAFVELGIRERWDAAEWQMRWVDRLADEMRELMEG